MIVSKTKALSATPINGSSIEPQEAEPKRNAKAASLIVVPALTVDTIFYRVIGISPLIVSAFPDKTRQQMIEKRSVDTELQVKGKGQRVNRPARDFDREFLDSLYPLQKPGAYGFPSVAFKRGMVRACLLTGVLDMTVANRSIFVHGPFFSKGAECVEIVGTPIKREDMVRLKGMDKNPDVRYRAEFPTWSATLEIEYNSSLFSPTGILNLLQHAGYWEGIGEMRPSSPNKSFGFGRYRLAQEGD